MVRGTAANQDGRTVNIVTPSADAQAAVYRAALAAAIAHGDDWEQGLTQVARARVFARSGQLADAQGGYEIQFRPDPTILDGRFANNPYLQELPKTPSMLTWDTVAMVSPATAKRLGLQNGAIVELDHRGRKTLFPFWVQPGH